MERELIVSGIGGQGVQLAAQVIARAALAEGRAVQMFGSYGGMMRGGNTEATVVVADGPVEAPPTIARTWSAILAHHDYSEPTIARLQPGSIVVVNTSVWDRPLDREAWHVVDVAAMDLAADLGNPLAASMVLAGAYAKATGLVALESLTDAVVQSLPSYRVQHGELNVRALAAGHEHAPRVVHAWERVA